MKKVVIILIALTALIVLAILLGSGILNPDKDLVCIDNYENQNKVESGHSSSTTRLTPPIYVGYQGFNKAVKNDGTIYNSNTMRKIDKFNFIELCTLKCNIAKLKMYIKIYDVPEADEIDTNKIVKIEDKTYRIKSIEILQNRASEIYEKIEKQLRNIT